MRRCNFWIPWLFMAPALLVLSVFLLYPIACGTVLAFCDFSMLRCTPEGTICWPRFIGLENFYRLWHDAYFWTALKNSLIYLLVVPVLQLGAILLATLLSEATWFNKVMRTCLYLPVVTSVVVIGIVWKWLLRSDGIINQLLNNWGIAAVSWLTDSHLAIFSLMLVTLWQGLGYYLVLYLAGLQAIPAQYSEAAKLDGADSFQVLTRITLPLLKPTAALCTLISSISALKVFTEVYIMTSGGPQNSTLTVVYYIYSQAFENYDMGYAAAVALVLASVVGAVSWVNYRIFREGGLNSWQ